MTDLTIDAGVATIALTSDEVSGIQARFSAPVLYRGSCLLIDRQTGLALDATPTPTPGTRPVLWPVHGAPWQQWHLASAGRGLTRITSDHGGLVLTVETTGTEGGQVWLDEPGAAHQAWRLKPSDDRVASVLEHSSKPVALDTGQDAGSLREPQVWGAHGAAWQQWIVCRLPLA